MPALAPTASLREYLFGGGARYPSRYRSMEVAGVAIYLTFLFLLARDCCTGLMAQPNLRWGVIPVAMVAYAFADFVTGLVHWFCDTYLSSDTPFLGPKFIHPFREHHTDQLAITRHDFVEASGDNCIAALATLVPTYYLVPLSTQWGMLLAVFSLVFSASILLTSLCHGWAHHDAPPRLIQRLQRWGLILSKEHHAQHHVAPHDRHYCITTGWMNPLLDRVGFFRKAEAVLDFCKVPRGH